MKNVVLDSCARGLLLLCMALVHQASVAQSNLALVRPQSAKPPILAGVQGANVEWRTEASTAGPMDMSQFKGKVVLFYYWATDCAVCLDKMSELRENVSGWKNKPFVLVAVNVDRKREDFDAYAKISKTILGSDAQCVLAYHKDVVVDNLSSKNRLPVSHIVDTQGQLKFTFSGRIPAQAWDSIAELLP